MRCGRQARSWLAWRTSGTGPPAVAQYYHALLREASTPNRRLKTAPGPEELAARQRAVKLELRRKLADLEERFAFEGLLRPAALAEFHVPGLAIDVRIQRKAATRTFRLFWNGVQKRLEPLRCSRCGERGL